GPGNDYGDIGPAGRARKAHRVAAEWIGNHPGNAATRVLIGGDICQPFREETRDVHVERRGSREHLRVSRPAEALIALRTVRGNVEKVAALTPHDVSLQLVEQRVRGDEASCLREVGGD